MTPVTAVPKLDLSELERHRPYLLRFTMLELRRKDAAEDVVQDVFLAAVKGADGFAGRPSVRTWLTSILVHKIADYRMTVASSRPSSAASPACRGATRAPFCSAS